VRRIVAATLCLALVAPVGAQPHPPPTGDANASSEADRLFEEGRRLLDAGRAAEACPYFERSQELDPGRGTLINIAACYEAVGRLVDALRVFRDVQQQSEEAGDAPRLQTARRRIAEIEARIPHLTLEVATPRPPGFVIAVDRVEVDVSSWADVIVDPGMVEIVASAPGYRRHETTVTVTADGSHATVAIPALERAVSGDPDSATVEMRRDPERVRIGQIVLGGGVVFVAGASVVALLAKRSYDDALDAECDGDPAACSAEGVDRTSRARTRGNVATVIGGVGLAAIAAGLVVWLTAPEEPADQRGVSLAPLPVDGGAGLVLTGAF
jgi:tetratricopeptide (TPR) repeat protein